MKLKYTLLLTLALSLPLSTLTVSAQSVNVRPTKKTNTTTKTNKTKKKTSSSNTTQNASNKTNKQQSNTQRTNTSASSSKGLSQQTLYTFAPGETIYVGEYVGSQKLSSTNFSLLTNYNGNNRFIINGRVVGEGRYISVDHLDIESSTPSYAFYMYDGSNCYINANGKQYGPFSSIRDYYVHQEDPSCVEITYEKMGMQFVQGYDGKTTQLEKGQSAYDASSPYVAKSPTGKYTARRTDNNKVFYLNNTRVALWPNTAQNVRIYNIMISDRGYARILSSATLNGAYTWREFGVPITTGVPSIVTSNDEYYDLTKGLVTVYSDEYASREGKIRRPFREPLDKYGADWDKGRLKTQYYLQTADRNHEFVGNWQYDYVSIDNQVYGKSYPLDAWYERAANAFVWVGLDGNRLVRYTYRF